METTNVLAKKRGRPFKKSVELPEPATSPKEVFVKVRKEVKPKDTLKPKEVTKVPKEKETKPVDNSLAGKIKAVEKVSMKNKKDLDVLSKKLDSMLSKIQ